MAEQGLPAEPTAVFDFDGPNARRFFIYREGILRENGVAVPPSDPRGWRIVVAGRSEEGVWRPLFDTWEEHFEDVHRYVTGHLPWRDEDTGQPLNLEDLVPG